MADDITLSTNIGTGAKLATDDLGGRHYQIIKLTFGALDAQTIASSGNGTIDAGCQRVTLASDGTGQVKLAAGTAEIGKLAAGTAAIGSLTAGTAEIGKLAAGVATIGEVTIGTATTAATDLGKAIDVAGGGSDVGIAALVIRDDNLSALTPVDGDYTTLRVGSTGALHVTGGGGGTEYTEDVATANPIVGTASMMERDDVLSALTPVAGDWASFRCSAEGALWTQEFNSDAILADTASMDTNLATVAGSVSVDDAAYTLGTDTGVMMMGFAGTQSVDANDAGAIAMDVDGAIHISDGGNVITVDGTVTANPASGTIDTVTTVTTCNLADETSKVIGTVRVASGGVASGAIASGAVASGAVASGAIASGALASGSIASGAVVDLPLPSGASTSVNQLPATSGGISTVYRDEDIDETDIEIKGSAGQIYWIHVVNLDATPVYLHFWDVAAASVTVGTTLELCSFCVPSQGDANGAGFTMQFPHGIAFGTAITVACTTTISGTSGPGTNEVLLNVGYE